MRRKRGALACVTARERHVSSFVSSIVELNLIIYEIKYKTNVVTQSFMPEFTGNLRTTKVLLTKFDRACLRVLPSCMMHRYDGARCSIARECIFPPEIVFYGRNSRIFHFFC